MLTQNNMLNIQQFNYMQHPYLLPNFMDVFTWSIPFVGEKVMEIFYSIIKPAEGLEDEDDPEAVRNIELQMMDESKKPAGLSEKAAKIQNKIKSIARMRLLMKTQKEKSEQMITGSATQGAPGGGLLEGPAGKPPLTPSYKQVLPSQRQGSHE